MSEERDMINEVPGSSPEFRTELAEQLAELVPEAVADGKIDVEKLKELLGGGRSRHQRTLRPVLAGQETCYARSADPNDSNASPG
ncbi:hypothetical protein FRC0434_02388 [Corynebacterium diphtheriae]|nr:hypothetical protein FRC0435_02388 [Corynebacterium diphtheriae]CAB0933624.1 hypothetical protein FRC0434_02388 [Corynebacterium diphtheriae]